MEIKCNNYPYLNYSNRYRYDRLQLRPAERPSQVHFGAVCCPIAQEAKCVEICEKKAANKIAAFFSTYVENIRHTIEHKRYFALIEKELFGSRSIDSYTHDADKLILYILGFPKKFVSKFHRKHSAHHFESHKHPNLRSMLCDNIASSPEFKPEKKLPLRDHFYSSKELQSIEGFEDILKRYNFGENLDFQKIKQAKSNQGIQIKAILRQVATILPFI